VPAAWTRPLSTWARGEQVLDAHTLALPPGTDPAGAVLRAGLYDAVTGERLPAAVDGSALPNQAAEVAVR
jgi:hypothetical protein